MRFEALGGFCFPPHMAQMRSLQCADLEEMAGGGGVFGGWSAGYVALYVPVSQSISPVLKGGWWASHAGSPWPAKYILSWGFMVSESRFRENRG